MLFGTKTRPVSDFLPRILSHIDGINVDMVATYTMDAIIQFLRDTKIMTEIICFNLDECTDSYKLSANNRIIEVISVRFIVNGHQWPNDDFQFRIVDDVFYINPIPICATQTTVEVEVAVAPSRDSEEVPDVLYEEWLDAITSLTLYKLYLLTDNSWYNPQAAVNHMTQYQHLVRQARFSRITKHKPLTMRLANMRRL